MRLFPINPTRDQIKINIPTPGIDLFKTSLAFSGASPMEFTSIFTKNTIK